MVMSGAHDASLVVLSVLIAVFASFTALSVASRIRASIASSRTVWIAAAAIALGGGIWSMHFVAMLAFSMPGMEVSYSLTATILSLAIAVLFTAGGFAVMRWEGASIAHTAAAGLLMGTGVVGMHYLGMAAMQMPATVSYDWNWVAVSVLIAVGAAIVAVRLAINDHKLVHQLVASCLMGLAISGMHYAGMRAATFRLHRDGDLAAGVASVDQTYLAMLVAGVTFLILLLALGAARLERTLSAIARRERRSALRLEIADILRGSNTNVALHEVAALMGRHFGVTRTGYGQLDPVEDTFDYDVCWTNGTVPPLLGNFPAAAFGVKIVAELNAGRTVVIDDLFQAQLSDEPRTRDTAQEVDTRAILVVPFLRDGRLRTIVYLNDRNPRKWRTDEVTFLEEIAERTRLVIERAAVEEELRQLNATLEERVESRTRELRQAQEALHQSQKMEAVGQLVSGLAHDFNNVLGAIVGAFDLVQRRPDEPERVRRFAKAGIEAAERGAKLTAQLLAFSRSQRIELQPLYVCDVIDAIRDMVGRSVGPMIKLEFDLNPRPVPVMADPTQIEMTVLNLAINARDAMPEGGSLLIATRVRDVKADAELSDGQYVEITVRDTGIGMDAETARRAMEPFFTTKPLGKGTGLGLAQIYGAVKQAGGGVRMESAPGEGTTVRVLLPCTDQQPRIMPSVAEAGSAFTPKSGCVLLVDDDPDLRSILASSLKSHGYDVEEAEDGRSALRILERLSPDVAIVDFAMPGMTGAELAQRILRRLPKMPILFASGYSDTAAIEAAVGPHRKMLRKPFRIEQLLSALDEALSTA